MGPTPSEHGTVFEKSRRIAAQRGFAGKPVIKLGVFVIVATAIAVGAYFAVNAFLLNDDAAEDDRRPVAVQRGTLLDDVTASGSVTFPELESLRFDISGSVAEILVDEGEAVTEGQTLIVLDDVTISALESAVAQAKIDLKDAGEDLAELLGGMSDLERTALESAAAEAEVDLQSAIDALADLRSGTTDLERTIALSDLADARVATAGAAEALAEFTGANGADSPAIVAAKEVLDEANEALADVLTDAAADAASQAETVSGVRDTFDEAAGDYASRMTGWFGSVVPEADRALSLSALYEKWNTTVDDIFAESTVLIDSPLDDPATPWSEPVVWVWTHLTPYAILTGCDSSSSLARCPSIEIGDAWDIRVAAEDTLDEAIADETAAATAQQKLVDAAREVVETAADAIIETTNDTDIAALAAALDEAVEREKEFETTINELDDLDELQVILATTAVERARVVLDGALEDLAEAGLAAPSLSGGGNDSDAAPGAPGGLDPLDLNLATAAVNQAKADLDRASEQLAGTQLVSPFAGVVTSISVLVGDPVSRATPTIDIVDLNVVKVEASVDEIDVLSLRVGDTVAVVLDALPDETLEGTVEEIGDGINQQGVIEFPLTITLVPPEGVDLIEGLSATATIVINQIDNALLIPLQSIGGSFNQPTVDVVTDNGFVTTAITLGASDDFLVIVESGLAEGQQVLMSVAESVDPFQAFFGGGFGRGGGGFPRGGGGGGNR